MEKLWEIMGELWGIMGELWGNYGELCGRTCAVGVVEVGLRRGVEFIHDFRKIRKIR